MYMEWLLSGIGVSLIRCNEDPDPKYGPGFNTVDVHCMFRLLQVVCIVLSGRSLYSTSQTISSSVVVSVQRDRQAGLGQGPVLRAAPSR